MEEFDLGSIWKDSNKEADAYYQSIEPEVLEMARQKSNTIYQKLIQNALAETAVGVIIWIMLVWLLKDHEYVWLFISVFILLVAHSGYKTWNLYRKLKAVPTQNIVDSIGGYHKILSEALRKIKRLILIFVPLGYIMGFFYGASSADGDITKLAEPKILIISIVGSIVVLGIMNWFIFKKYLVWMYEKPLQDLKEIHEGLLNDSQIQL